MKNIITLLILISCSLTAQAQQQNNKNEVSIISWNIRDFGKTKSDSVINAIANTVKAFDIVALQEVVSGYGGSQAVAKLADALNRKGSKWDYAISMPTKSPPYKTEKYAYLWKTSKVSVYKKARLISELNPIVYREPLLIGFKIGNKKVDILNYHSRKHNDSPEEEIKEIIKHLNTHNQTVLLGDFNLTENHTVWKQLYANGYTASLKNSPTTLKKKCKNGSYLNHPIDNIYYPKKKITIIKAGRIDFVENCLNLKASYSISDHLPIYLNFHIN